MTFATLPEVAMDIVISYLSGPDVATVAVVNKAMHAGVVRRRRARAFRLLHEGMRWVDANPGHLVIGGSMALWFKLKTPHTWTPNDLDLFVVNYQGCSSRVGLVGETFSLTAPAGGGGKPLLSFNVCRTVADIGFHKPAWRIMNVAAPGGGKMQFILSTLFPTCEAVLASFDITGAMVAIVGSRAGVPAVQEGEQYSWPECVVKVDTVGDIGSGPVADLQRACALRTHNRAAKYIARGATVVKCVPTTAATRAFADVYIPTLLEMERAVANNFHRIGGSVDLPEKLAERRRGVWRCTTV